MFRVLKKLFTFACDNPKEVDPRVDIIPDEYKDVCSLRAPADYAEWWRRRIRAIHNALIAYIKDHVKYWYFVEYSKWVEQLAKPSESVTVYLDDLIITDDPEVRHLINNTYFTTCVDDDFRVDVEGNRVTVTYIPLCINSVPINPVTNTATPRRTREQKDKMNAILRDQRAVAKKILNDPEYAKTVPAKRRNYLLRWYKKQLQYAKNYYNTANGKLKKKQYDSRPDVVARRKEYQKQYYIKNKERLAQMRKQRASKNRVEGK